MFSEDECDVNLSIGDSEASYDISTDCDCQCCMNVATRYYSLDVSDSKVSHVHQSKEREEEKLKLTQEKYILVGMTSTAG